MEFPRLMTAMITPFNQEGEVDYSRVRELAEWLGQNGSGGIVVCGTTGESPTLTTEEKLKLFAAVKDEVGDRIQVWAGVGTDSTASTAALTKEAARLGVDGVMAVTPYYNKPSQEGLYRHFKAIAEATSLPVMLYNVPGRTSINLLPETVARLAEIENIMALKEASGSMDQMSQLKNSVSKDFIIYSGDDSLTLPMMALGAHGVISVASHLVGNEIKNMIEAYIEGRVKEAQKLHTYLFSMFKVLFITTNPVPLKEALRLVGRDSGVLRGPLCEAEKKERFEIERVLKEFNLFQ